MPIPKPGKREQQRDFIARCMGALINEFPRQDQRYAVCVGAWRDKDKDFEDTEVNLTDPDELQNS